jgi:hypothetical protein
MAALVSGCATAPSRPVSVVVPQPCRPFDLVEYTRAEQTRAADELDALQRDTMLERMVEDYGALRVAARLLHRCFTVEQGPALP